MADARSPSGCASSAQRLLFFRSCSGDANVILPLDRVKDRDLIPDPFRAVTPESSPNREARWLDLHGVPRPRPATPASPPRPSGPRRHRHVAHHSRILARFPVPALGSFWSASRKSIRKPSPRVPSPSRREARVFTERPTRPPRSGPLTPPRSLSSPGHAGLRLPPPACQACLHLKALLLFLGPVSSSLSGLGSAATFTVRTSLTTLLKIRIHTTCNFCPLSLVYFPSWYSAPRDTLSVHQKTHTHVCVPVQLK